MRYGKTQSVSINGSTTQTNEARYHDWQTVISYTRNCESIAVSSIEQALAEFLKLIDLQKSGQVSDIGIACFAGKNNKITRIETTWVTKDASS